MRIFGVASLLAAGALLSSGCDTAREIPEEHGGGPVSACSVCHTGPGDTGAFRGVEGGSAESIGAHEAHLGQAIPCSTCHPSPGAPGHNDGLPAEIVLSGLAAGGTYNAKTCSNVYCHVGPAGGGAGQETVAWTATLACGSCHTLPPPPPHPVDSTCVACHPGTINPDGSTNGVNHVNGEAGLDVHPSAPLWLSGSGTQPHGRAANFHTSTGGNAPDPGFPNGINDCKRCHGADFTAIASGNCNTCHGGTAWQTNCTFCHGDAARATNKAAPPVDTEGLLASDVVGAHQAHLAGKTISNGVECDDCHAVPTDLSHVNGTAPVRLEVPGTAIAAGNYAAATGTCDSTYCHGGFTNGKAGNTPVWTATGGQASCDTCHPPQWWTESGNAALTSSRHESHDCTRCHGQESGRNRAGCDHCHEGFSYRTNSLNKASHVNGTIDVSGAAFGGTWDPATKTCSGNTCHTIGAHSMPTTARW